MPSLAIRTVGAGPKRTAMWLDGVPCIFADLTEWPKVGGKYVSGGGRQTERKI